MRKIAQIFVRFSESLNFNVFWLIIKKKFQGIHEMFSPICFTTFSQFEPERKKKNLPSAHC
jgi:hypothetical protein